MSWQLFNVIQHTTLAIHQFCYLKRKEDKFQSICQMTDEKAQYYQKAFEIQTPKVDEKIIAEHQIKIFEQISSVKVSCVMPVIPQSEC